jgi:ParB family transcriptional regulator, chromosome partitioning protein
MGQELFNMNTMTLSATQALEAAVPAQAMLLVALSALRFSKRNVRKTGGTPIVELAASIERVGLLQNLTVIACADGEHYEVVAGGRRLAALKLLAKQKRLPKDYPVPCLLVADASARTASLTENVQREPMHPADQFEAFAALVAEGRSIEDIAADFGVTPLVVQRRLKLANVSPRLLADYRSNAVTLEQLMALAITDDHAAQEAAFYDSPAWERSPQALREHLTHEEIEAGQDALARFVGVDAYVSAGGGVRRDLFSDEQQGLYLADAGLLHTLARDKLAAVSEQVRAEGWSWVEVVPRATAAQLHSFQRARRTRREPSKAEAKRIAKLEAKQSELQDRLDDESVGMSDADAQALNDELDQLGDQLEVIEQSLTEYAPRVVAAAGAVVSVDHIGGVVVHRGLLREEQAKALRTGEQQAAEMAGGATGADAPAKSGISEKLAKRLSAHRTAALQAEVARHPHVALVALVHRLALSVIVEAHYTDRSPVNITAVPQRGLETHAPDIAQSPALMGMLEVRRAWAERLPQDSDALFTELLALPQRELLSLLAVCVAETVGALSSSEGEVPGAALARAVGLDMHDWWTPTAAGYFEHVAKARVLEVVQVIAPDHVKRLEKVKKAELASEAERLVMGTGWLPSMFRLDAWNDAAQAPQMPEGRGERAEGEVPDEAAVA